MGKLKGVIFVLLLLILVVAVSAQDSDLDGIKDEFDACPATSSDETLPIIKKHIEYFGCSCPQLQSVIGENTVCMNIYCIGGRPLEIEYLSVSKEEIVCGEDFCIGSTLYDYPEPEIKLCANGMIEERYCTPIVINQSDLCVDGTVPQRQEEKPPFEITITEDNEQVEQIPNSYFAFDILLENDNIKKYVGNPDREEFQENINYILNKVEIKKEIKPKDVDGTDVSIPFMTITITPKANGVLKNVIVFEKIENDDFFTRNFVSFNKDPLIVREDGFVVWALDEVPKEGIELKYQINKPMVLETETILAGTYKGRFFLADWWPILLIPILGYLTYRYMVAYKE